MAEKAEKFPQNVQATPILFSLQMKHEDATISKDKLLCSGNDESSSVALGEYPMDASTKRKFFFQFTLQGDTNTIGMGVSKNTNDFSKKNSAIMERQCKMGLENAFPGWTSEFKKNTTVTMTMDTGKGELTLFNLDQVSLGTYRNDQLKNGVFYPACSVWSSASKVSITNLTPRMLERED